MSTEIETNGAISISQKAIEQIRKLRSEQNLDENHHLRIGVQGGGCSGFTYKMSFDAEAKSGDTVIKADDVQIRVDGKSLFYLSGTELDFSDGLNGRGFVFNNPNASRTCGCGESFAI